MDRRERVTQLTAALAPVVITVACRSGDQDPDADRVGLDLENARLERLLDVEVRSLVADHPTVEEAARRYATARPEKRRQRERALLLEVERTLRRHEDRADALWTLLTGYGWTPPEVPAVDARARGPVRRTARASWEAARAQVAAIVMLGIIGAVLAVAVALGDRRYGQVTAVEIFAIWALSFLPGWMFVRFIGLRAGALWDEYVLNLHRLQLDEPEHLPRPPASSSYSTRWLEGGGPLFAGSRNIYREKFDAYYGKDVSRHSSRTTSPKVSPETLFPVFLTTAILAVAWTAVLWGDRFLPRPGAAPSDELDAMVYGFAGAYFFSVQMLVRRFFQSDLKSSAYASVVVRIVTVLLLVAVIDRLGIIDDDRTEAALAFLIGVFPLVGLQVLQRLASGVLKFVVPTLQVDYPLSDLQGLNIWYEARLLEEGIEDMQNLVTANVVDVVLHTRVPVGRLVDWQDQALLYLRLPPRRGRRDPWAERWRGRRGRRTDGEQAATGADPAAAPSGVPASGGRQARTAPPVAHVRDVLRRIGVADATSFLDAFPPSEVAATEGRVARLVAWFSAQPGGLQPAQIETISHLLADDAALHPVTSWRGWRLASPACDLPTVRPPHAAADGAFGPTVRA